MSASGAMRVTVPSSSSVRMSSSATPTVRVTVMDEAEFITHASVKNRTHPTIKMNLINLNLLGVG